MKDFTVKVEIYVDAFDEDEAPNEVAALLTTLRESNDITNFQVLNAFETEGQDDDDEE